MKSGWFIFCLILAARPLFAAEKWPQQTLIVYNDRDPDSRLLADYYAQRRGIPTNLVCAIHARPVETITRREFNDDVREPILRFLTRNGLLVQRPYVVDNKPRIETIACRISCIALIYGVPLRIESDPTVQERAYTSGTRPELIRNEASVDSELALLPVYGLPVCGPLRNPLFDTKAGGFFDPPMNRRLLLVGRLDGPDTATVRRMIDDAITAEQYGLHGRAYFDARGIQDRNYVDGDYWIKNSHESFVKAGFECELDENESLFGEDHPMTDVVFYTGWYCGNVVGAFTRSDFKFRPGAIAYHIHSSSAATVRTRVTGWVGPMLTKGAAASMGSVFEPYLAMTPHIDIFSQRILAGRPFLESAYVSDPMLSWQNTYVGDPLYRPFAKSLDEQILLLKFDKRPELEWALLRKVNLLNLATETDAALELCRTKAAELQSIPLHEKLGDLQANTNAITAYQRALTLATDNGTRVRVSIKLANVFEREQRNADALAVYEGLSASQALRKNAVKFYEKSRDLARTLGDNAKAKAWQIKVDEYVQALEKTPRKD
jgi:uncharacterized protein (TIGR03790 family)